MIKALFSVVAQAVVRVVKVAVDMVIFAALAFVLRRRSV
jgi:hypothetical protein